MSAALDERLAIGANHPPAEIDTSRALIDVELLTAQLETDHVKLVNASTNLIVGAVRFIKTYGTMPFVEALPDTGFAGNIVRCGENFHRFVGKSWTLLTPQQTVALLLPTVKIADAPTAEKVTSFVKQIKATGKLLETQRVVAKEPYDAAAKAVQAFFKQRLQDPLDAAAKGLEGCLTTYQRIQAQLEREAREAEAKRLREEAEIAAAAARRTEHEDVIDTAEAASVVADKAQRAAVAPVADLARVAGSMGGVAAAQTVWSWEIADESKIPREYFLLDRTRIDREVRSLKNGFAVPGIKVTSDIKASVR